jgi:hypothetical protein
MFEILHYAIIAFFAVVCVAGGIYMARNINEF